MYGFVLIVNCKIYRKVRTTGGVYGVEDTDNLFEDKIIGCLKCCFKNLGNAANKQLDKHDQ